MPPAQAVPEDILNTVPSPLRVPMATEPAHAVPMLWMSLRNLLQAIVPGASYRPGGILLQRLVLVQHI